MRVTLPAIIVGSALFALLQFGAVQPFRSLHVPNNDVVETDQPLLARSPGDLKRARLANAMNGVVYTNERAFVAEDARRGRDPDAASAAYERGWLHWYRNESTAMVAAFTQAVVSDDGEAGHFRALGRALLRVKKTEEAIAAFRSALILDDSDMEARYWLAEAHGRRSAFATAAAELEAVVAQAPSNGEAWSRLAVYRYYIEDLPGAQAALERAEALDAPVPGALSSLIAGEVPRADVRTLDRSNAGGAAQGLSNVNVGPAIRIDTGGTFGANEPSIIMDEAATPTVVAGWNDYRESDKLGGQIRIGAGISEDGGQTWTDTIVRPPADRQGRVEGDPMTAYDPLTGNFWVGGISFDDSRGGVFVARKDPNAAAFEPAVMAALTGFADKGLMAAGRAPGIFPSTNLYVAYNQGLLTSGNFGATWNGPTPIDAGSSFLPRVASDGTLHIVYRATNGTVGLATSSDAGAMFTNRTVAPRMFTGQRSSGSIPGTFRVSVGMNLAIDPISPLLLYSVWSDLTNVIGANANFDIYFARSEDGGATWTSPVVINNESLAVGDQWFPWIEADGDGRLHVMYYDTRHVFQPDNAPEAFIHTYYNYSDDRGDSWTEVRITAEPFNSELDGLDTSSGNAFIGDYQTITASSGSGLAIPCYLSNENGDSDIFVNVIQRVDQLIGDMNCDGVVSVGDINPFVLALTDPIAYASQFPDCDILAGDCTGDDKVRVGDINCFVALVTGG